MNRSTIRFLLVAVSFCLRSTFAFAESFSDNFEGPVLGPFWTSHTLNANMVLTTEQAHSGTQSLRFQSSATGGQKTVQLGHGFAHPVYGTFSVWLRDPGTGGFFSLYATPAGPHLDWGHRIFAEGGLTSYRYSTPEGANAGTTVTRIPGWHQLQIAALESSVTYSIDGQSVYAAPGAGPISTITFIAHDAASFPNVYFDDFSGVWTAIPEPSSLLMSLAGTLLLACQRRGRRTSSATC